MTRATNIVSIAISLCVCFRFSKGGEISNAFAAFMTKHSSALKKTFIKYPKIHKISISPQPNLTSDGIKGAKLVKGKETNTFFNARETHDSAEYIDFLLSQLAWDMRKYKTNKMKECFQVGTQRNAICKCGKHTVTGKEGKWTLEFTVDAKK